VKRLPDQPPPKSAHLKGVKVPPGARSCGVGIDARLEEGKLELLRAELGARGVFGTEDQCAIGPLRAAANEAPFKLLDAAMPRGR